MGDIRNMLDVVREWFAEDHPGDLPKEMIVVGVSGREVRHSFPTAPHSSAQRPPVADQPIPEEEDTPVVRGIFRLLWDATTRLTGGQIADRLMSDPHPDGSGFSQRNIARQLTQLAREGRLVSHPTEPSDGLGRGYGLPDWES